MPYSLYLHIPFCQVRCSYCDFNTYAGLESLVPAYTSALAREVRAVARAGGGEVALPIHTVFFGGGTPSLLPLAELSRLLQAIRASFSLSDDVELTLEANPGTVDLRYLEGLRSLGVNRLSFGAQSAHPAELRLLGRLHTFEAVARAVAEARAAGFDNLNLDLMFGLPYQSLGAWRESVEAVLDLSPEHLSLYALTLEHGTPMQRWVERGLLAEPDPDRAAEMYEWCSRRLAREGFVQYEISNWARSGPGGSRDVPARACRHNLQYWRNEPYLGFGAGAHGCAGGWRYSNVRSPRGFIRRMEGGGPIEFPFSPALAQRERISPAREMEETMMLALRLTGEGVGAGRFAARFGCRPHEVYAERLAGLEAAGLVVGSQERVRLTARGRLLANRVFAEFVEAP